VALCAVGCQRELYDVNQRIVTRYVCSHIFWRMCVCNGFGYILLSVINRLPAEVFF